MNLLKTLTFLFIITISGALYAQKMDIGVMLGGSYYYGDVVNELEPSTIRPAFGGFLRYRLTDRLAVKGFLGYTKVAGDDALSESQWQRERNWSFETSIFETSAQLEFNLIEDRNRGRRFSNPFIPYLFGGFGFFSFNPTSEVAGVSYSVAPLQLSGKSYSTSAYNIPLGIGFRYYVAKNIQLGFELGIRYTTTSYIDDIAPEDTYVNPSATPNPTLTNLFYAKSTANKNPGDLRSKMGNVKDSYGSNTLNQIIAGSDFYFFNGVTFAYTLGKTSGGGSGRRGGSYGKAIRCPRFY